MKLFSKIKNTVGRLPRKTAVTIAALTVLISIPLAVKTFAEWSPIRQTFDYNKPCNPDDNDPYDRCGSLTGPVFNSFINTPSYGDERAFLDARRSDQTASGSYKNVLPDVTKGSKEIVVRMYIHNNANESTNSTNGMAKNTRVRIALPDVEGSELRAVGYISADNAIPKTVIDTVDFTSTEKFKVAYKPGSAIIYNAGPFKNGVKISDNVVTSGAPIGWDALNGDFPGCFEFDAQVQITLTVTPKEKTDLDIEKLVRKTGDKNWVKEVNASPGEEVEWVVNTQNNGQAAMTDVTTRDVLPPHVELVSGSVKYIDSHGTVQLQDGPFFAAGNNAGLYNPGNNTLVTFKTKLLGDFEECEVRVRNVAFAKSKEHQEIKDDADVIITKDDCEPEEPKEPIYRCDKINSIFLRDRTYRFTTDATAQNGATIKQYNYEVTGPNNYRFTQSNNQPNGQFDHAFPGTGTFVVMVTVDFTVDGRTVSHTSPACKTSITIPKEEDKCPIPGKQHLPKNHPDCKEVVPPVVVTPTSGKLPVTGPGEMVGMFVAVTIAGTMAHRFVFARRYM